MNTIIDHSTPARNWPGPHTKLRRAFPAFTEEHLVHADGELIAFLSEGPVALGHTLISPTSPSISFATYLHDRPDRISATKRFVSDVRGLLAAVFGKETVVFEHGPSDPGSCLGCGVDYAHLHIVPSNITTRRLCGPSLEWHRERSIADLERVRLSPYGYLFTQTGRDCQLAAARHDTPSQYFRRAVAQYEGIGNYDWRVARRDRLTREASERLSAASAVRSVRKEWSTACQAPG